MSPVLHASLIVLVVAGSGVGAAVHSWWMRRRPHRAGVYPGSTEHQAALDEAALRAALQQAAVLGAAEAVIDTAWARLAPYYEQKEAEPWPPAV
ncbi:hypothetical protein ACFYMH_27815 [Streptomyces albidoflavus]